MRRLLASTLFLLLAARCFGQQEDSSRLQELLTEAQQAQSSNDYAKAAAAYAQAVKLRKDIPELWANLGLMQHETGDYTGAIQSFSEANRQKASLYVPNLFLGMDYVQTGHPKQAVPFLVTAERMNGHDPLPSLTLGRAYNALGEYRLAEQQLRQAIAKDPKQSSAWFSLGIVSLHEVEADSRAMVANHAESGYAKALFAQALVKQGRLKEASDLYTSVLGMKDQPPCVAAEKALLDLRIGNRDVPAAQPGCTLCLLTEARIQVEHDDPAEAIVLLTKAWKRDAGFFRNNVAGSLAGVTQPKMDALLGETITQEEQSQEQLMMDSLRDALQGTPEPAVAVEVMPLSVSSAESAFSSGEYARCASSLHGALKSGNASEVSQLAACASFAGDDELAAQAGDVLRAMPREESVGLYWSIKSRERLAMNALAHFQELEPDSARSHLLLGDIYRQRRYYGQAREEYGKALKLTPDDPAALLGLAACYLADQRYEDAAANARKALEKSPDDPEINVLLGETLLDQRKYADAEPYLLKGLRAKPQMLPHVHAMLGEAYAAEGKDNEAIAELKQGLSSDDDGGLYFQIARLYQKAGDKADADAAFARMKVLREQQRSSAQSAFQDAHTVSIEE